MKNDTLPSQICSYDNQHSKVRQNLCDVVNKRICTDRPISIEQFTPIGNGGGQKIEIREPEFGEVGLSKSEIDHAIQYRITM